MNPPNCGTQHRAHILGGPTRVGPRVMWVPFSMGPTFCGKQRRRSGGEVDELWIPPLVDLLYVGPAQLT
jgi:hypothetical protein